jgi:hypothetical protein
MSNTTWKAYERRIVRWIRDGLGIPTERNIQESRNGNEGDIHGELRSWCQDRGNGMGPVVARLVGQAKFRKAPSPWKSQEEADEATTSPSDIAFGIVRRKGDQTLVTLRPRVFGALLIIASQQIATNGPGVWKDALAAADTKDMP